MASLTAYYDSAYGLEAMDSSIGEAHSALCLLLNTLAIMKLSGFAFALALAMTASTTLAQQTLGQPTAVANGVEDATSSTEAATSGSTEAATSGSTEAATTSSSLEAASGSSSGSAATATTEAPVSSGSEAQATIMVLVPENLAPSGSGSLVADAGWLDKLLHPDVGTGSASNTTTAPATTSGTATASHAAGLLTMGLATLAWTLMG